MKTNIKFFITTFLSSILFISCGGDNELENEKENLNKDELEVLKSLNFNTSDNIFLADDVTAKIKEHQKEITVVISVLSETPKSNKDVTLKAQIETSENVKFSQTITIKKDATEVPVEVTLNGKKVKYTLKPKVIFINEALVGVMNPKDLAVLFKLSENEQMKNIFKGIDLNSVDKDDFVKTIKGLKDQANTFNNIFKFDPTDKRIVYVSLMSLSLIKDAGPTGIYDFEELNVLNLRDTHISELPAELGKLKKLKKLYIDRTAISKIPKEIGKLTELIEFSATSTPLKEFPSEFGNCTKLKILFLAENGSLTKMPDFVGKLEQLTDLRLDNCRITEIPASIGNLTKLKTFKINNNIVLKTISEKIGECTELTNFNFTKNSVEVIPSEIVNLKKLTHLYGPDNRIEIIPKGIGKLSELKILDLENNNLKKFEYGTDLSSLTKLNTLLLDGEIPAAGSNVSHEGNINLKVSQYIFDQIKNVANLRLHKSSEP